ncbi:MAG TPA: fused MFS/spermidine synthase [Burkholderiaceae bacterium]|nr:fused MFS/spermidine synthase [Burkholderiaceae bacterium]
MAAKLSWPLAHAPARARWQRGVPIALLLASGFAGLGYQLVWTQQCALWLGHEAAAVLAVVAALFGGLALGAFALGARVERSAHPLRWYVGCELAIAAWGALLTGLMAPASDALLALAGPQPAPWWQWTVAFGGTFALLLPATAAMGATLPALERVVGTGAAAGRRSIAALYAANTLGAVAGVLVCTFWLAPALGFVRTAALCVALNLWCAAFAWTVLATTAIAAPPIAAPSASTSARRAALTRLAASGLLGIGYEVLVVRVLGQVSEDTVYTYAMLLAVYLAGTALGAALYRRRSPGRDATAFGERLPAWLAAACLLGIASLWAAEGVRDALLARIGHGMAGAIGAEAVPALLAFALPTLAMGALFSHLAERANAAGASFGHAFGVNTLGAAAAPLVFGVLLAPALGPKNALLVVVLGYLALVPRRAWTTLGVALPAAAALGLLVAAPPLAFVDVPEGGRVVSYRDGVVAAVSVVEDADGVARLRIDNRQQEGSNATRRVDARQALIPLLLHPAPRHALFLGLGTGVTASAAADDPALEVDAVELLPEVIEASRLFTRGSNDAAANPRLHVIAADARRYVRSAARRYDLIVADNFHPARSGAGSLYTVEHFAAVRARLADGGLFCQWLPLHQLDLDTLRSIVRSFLAVNPGATALLANNGLDTPVLGLVGHGSAPARVDVAALRDRLAHSALPQPPASFGLDDEFALLGSFVAGPASLARFAEGAPLNTDDHPVVAYRAPRITYAPDSRPRDRLAALLGGLSITPADVLAPTAGAAAAARLAAYWAARDRFIAVGIHVRRSADVQAMLAQVRAPLLEVLRLSADFRPAYDPLLQMAAALAPNDPAAAHALAHELAHELATLVPARPEAARLAQALVARAPSR